LGPSALFEIGILISEPKPALILIRRLAAESRAAGGVLGDRLSGKFDLSRSGAAIEKARVLEIDD